MALLDTGLAFARAGLEAGPLSQWLHEAVARELAAVQNAMWRERHRVLLGTGGAGLRAAA